MKSKLIIPLVILFVLILGVSSITIVAFYTRDNNANEKTNLGLEVSSINDFKADETPSNNNIQISNDDIKNEGTDIPTKTEEVKEQENIIPSSSSNKESNIKTNTSSSSNKSSSNTLNENKNSSNTTTDTNTNTTQKGICTTNDSEYNAWLNNFLNENLSTRIFDSLSELRTYGNNVAKNYGYGYYYSPNPIVFDGTNCTKSIYTLQLYAAADDCGNNPFMYIPREESLTDVYSYLRLKGYSCDNKSWF